MGEFQGAFNPLWSLSFCSLMIHDPVWILMDSISGSPSLSGALACSKVALIPASFDQIFLWTPGTAKVEVGNS